MMMTVRPAMLARAASRPEAVRPRTAVRAAACNGVPRKKAAKMQKAVHGAGAVLGGAVAVGLAQALVPEPAMALGIRDPVFGDIEVWQFIVLTAGYWLGIEYYLDRKYDDDKKDIGSIMPKVSEAKKSSFAEANARKEAENAE